MNNIENIIIEKFLDERIPLDKAVELLEAAEKKHVGPISQAKNQIKQFKQDMEETNKQIEDTEKKIKEEQEKFEKRRKQAKKIMKAAAIAGVGIAGVGAAATIYSSKHADKENDRLHDDAIRLRKFNDEVEKMEMELKVMDKNNLKTPEYVDEYMKRYCKLREKYGI